VSIRYLADALSHDVEYLQRCRAQARLLADLDSPYVAALYEYVEADHGVAIVREYVEGVSLRVLIASPGAMSTEAALGVLKAGLLGLRAGHAVGATHGGYKPDNVLVDLAGRAKLSDFGLAAAPCTATADMSAAVATFVECLAGPGGDAAVALDRVPKRLHGFVAAMTTQSSAASLADRDRTSLTLLAELETRPARRTAPTGRPVDAGDWSLAARHTRRLTRRGAAHG
jgi:serine/threonine protein kinase